MQKVVGELLFLAGAVVMMGIITAEIFYPGYSVSKNMISTLGASPPPDSVVREPAAAIFDSTMLASGIIILIAAYLMRKAFPTRNSITVSTMFLGIGAMGVGIFPAFHEYAHPISAFTAFLAGGICSILSSRVTTSPFKFYAIALGGLTLVFLSLGIFSVSSVVPLLGAGGTERWVAYPTILWLVGFGGYLMNTHQKSEHHG